MKIMIPTVRGDVNFQGGPNALLDLAESMAKQTGDVQMQRYARAIREQVAQQAMSDMSLDGEPVRVQNRYPQANRRIAAIKVIRER